MHLCGRVPPPASRGRRGGSVKATSFIPFPHWEIGLAIGIPAIAISATSCRAREIEPSAHDFRSWNHSETERNGSPLLVSEWMLAEHSRAWLPSNKAMRARCGIARLYTTCGQAGARRPRTRGIGLPHGLCEFDTMARTCPKVAAPGVQSGRMGGDPSETLSSCSFILRCSSCCRSDPFTRDSQHVEARI